LITSDTNGEIYLWNPVDGARWNIDANAFREHQGSVEDLQWNPAEAEVFASASTDRTIKVWDCRTRNKSVMSWSAHDSDVNVISWNAKANRLIVSGSDDGSFKIWDIRKIQEGDLAPRLNFNWHKKPITSVEWDPNDESSLCVGAEDDTVRDSER
jgi:ribosome assembly protein RRB1